MFLSRRSLFKRSSLLAGAATLPSWMPRLAFRQPGVPQRGDVLVVIFQRGGMDGLSAVVPYEEPQYYNLRPRIAFKQPNAGDPKTVIPLTAQFGLNPALVGLQRAWDNGHLAVVTAAGSPDPSRSHFDAMDYMERGTPGQKSSNDGWLGRHLATTAKQNDSPFRAIGMGSILQQSLRGPVPAAALQSIADFHLQGRSADLAIFRQQLEALYGGGDWFDQDARATFQALDMLEAANLHQSQPENGAVYPDSPLGNGLKQIAQLIKADLGLEIACVDMGGWDTHVNMVWTNNGDPTFGQMYNLLKQLNDAIFAFYTDLGRDRFEDPGVTLVTMSEFGRRVAQNAANGTDHGHGNSMFILSGAAVQGVHTQWPGLEPQNLVDGDLAITTDYRDILSEILLKRLGNPQLDLIFPGYTPVFRGVVNGRPNTPPLATPPPAGGQANAHAVYLPRVGKK